MPRSPFTEISIYHYRDHHSDKIWGHLSLAGQQGCWVFWGRTPGTGRGRETLQWQRVGRADAFARSYEKEAKGYRRTHCDRLDAHVCRQAEENYRMRDVLDAARAHDAGRATAALPAARAAGARAPEPQGAGTAEEPDL